MCPCQGCEAVLSRFRKGQPLPPQNMVTLKQAAGVVLYAALNLELRGRP
jgi:hypothetical protein